MKAIKIVSRKSPLARIQALLVAERISEACPDLQILHEYKTTLGDSDLTTPLNKMPDIGVFTNDIRNDLIDGRADIAVHSWKDLPVDLEEGTEIVGTIERADMRDMIFIKKDSMDKANISILSSSPRRERNLSNFLPLCLPFKTQISFKDVRGNIHTRLNKLIKGEDDGLVIAKAAIDRFIDTKRDEFLNEKNELLKTIDHLKWMVLPLSHNPCAAAQGALAIEARQDDEEIKSIISKISFESVFNSIEAERMILKSYGGGCHQKIGVSNEVLETGTLLTVQGETEEGEDISVRSFSSNSHKDYFDSINKENYYPINRQEQTFFERKLLADSYAELKSIKNAGIYVSRSNTIDGTDLIDDSNIIWTSGIDTWKSLAKKGYWVNGTSDSLGENNSPEESPFAEKKWYKITHADNTDSSKQLLPTYELEPLELSARLQVCDYFYWMSASSFQLAIDRYPEIRNKNHACGLGKTFDLIKKEAENTVAFLSYDSWIENISNQMK